MLKIEPPVLPLSLEDFRKAIYMGHGRAMKHVLEHGAAGVENALVQAAVSCPIYDPQMEEKRASWICDMVSHAVLVPRVLEAIQHAADAEPTDLDYWDWDHRCSILLELVNRSIPGARDLLYSMVVRVTDTAGVVGSEQIVKLDRAAGLVFLARRLGQWLAQDPNFWVDNAPIKLLDELEGPGTGLRALNAARKHDPDVARFLQSLQNPVCEEVDHLNIPNSRADSHQSYMRRMQSISSDEVIALVRSDPNELCYWLVGWGRHANMEARRAVFTALLEEMSPSRIARFLRAFGRIGPPYFDERLLHWIDMEESDVGFEVLKVLAHVEDIRVREVALSWLGRGELVLGVIPLLTRNFRPGDHRLIENALQPIEDEDNLHWLLSDVLDVFKANSVLESTASLCFVYEYTPCTDCRLRALELLKSLGSTPAWIVDEGRLDALEAIRTLTN